MRTLSSRERKLIALLILCGIAGAVWLIVVGPVLAGFSERATQRAMLVQQYQANQRIIGSIPRLRRQIERQREGLKDYVVSAPTQEMADLALQERVQRVIERAGGEVRSIEGAADGGAQIRARASARLTLAQLTVVIARLQNDPPFLAVELLNVSADQAALSGRLDVMEVSLEVSVPVVLAKSR